ncbi:MAG: hypothetical protein GY937_08410 [bacterium]|nr:hypothetical protein [bacterium]
MKRRVPFPLGIAILGIAFLGLSLPGAVSAVGLTPAGPCARSDALSLSIGAGEPENSADVARMKGGSSQVARTSQTLATTGGSSTPAQAVGPARHRFAPTSVGAGLPPNTAGLGPPSTARTSHPGACGSAGSICGGRVAPNPQAVVSTRTTPRSRPRRLPPIVVDPSVGTGCGPPGFGCP